MSRGPEVGELNQVPVPYLICPQLQSLLPESLARSLLPGTGCQKQLLAAQVQLQSGTAELQAELLQSQALLADLQAQVRGQGPPAVMGACHCEGSLRNPPPVLHAVPLTVFQVRKLELERAQHKLLLESLQQRHQADLELIENAHRYALPCLWPPGAPRGSWPAAADVLRGAPPTAGSSTGRSRVKVLETSYQQREERLRRENEALSSQYLSQCQAAEQARAELTAQHQRHLAAAMQEKDQEVERLRELQR